MNRYQDLPDLDKLLEEVESQPQKIAKMILDRLSNDQRAQIIDGMNRKLINNVLSAELSKVKEELQEITAKLMSNSQIEIQPPRQNVSTVSYHRKFEWGDRLHDFPEDFTLPQADCLQLWRLWLYGDPNRVNIPYRLLKGEYMSKVQRACLSKAKIVMEAIRERIGRSYTELTALDHHHCERIFTDAYLDLFSKYRYHENMKYTNAYKHLLAMRKDLKNNLKKQ